MLSFSYIMRKTVVSVPLRVSFVGGSTDLPAFYNNDRTGGFVVSCAIDKSLELVNGDASCKFFGMGLGASSAKYVAETARKFFIDNPGNFSKKTQAIAEEAFALESLTANLGKQDHYACAYGGLRTYSFMGASVLTELLSEKAHKLLENHCFLYPTQRKHESFYILNEVNENIKKGRLVFDVLKELRDTAILAARCLREYDLIGFSGCIDKGWRLKQQTAVITNDHITGLMTIIAGKKGYLAGKLLGAGRGGYLLSIFDSRESRDAVANELPDGFPLRIKRRGVTVTEC